MVGHMQKCYGIYTSICQPKQRTSWLWMCWNAMFSLGAFDKGPYYISRWHCTAFDGLPKHRICERLDTSTTHLPHQVNANCNMMSSWNHSKVGGTDKIPIWNVAPHSGLLLVSAPENNGCRVTNGCWVKGNQWSSLVEVDCGGGSCSGLGRARWPW